MRTQHTPRRLVGLVAAAAIGLSASLAAAQDGDPNDQGSVNVGGAITKLERQGYRNLQLADRSGFDNQIELRGINPQGEAVIVTLDTTTGSKLYEKPAGR
ncbi:MAG: hypothetical protein ACTS10_04115 [Kiloniellales bacterium]